MKRKFIISALTLSPVGTMGGNSKITLEMARYLAKAYEVHFIVPRDRTETFRANVAEDGIALHEVGAFGRSDLRHPIAAALFYTREMRRVLDEVKPGPDDFLYGCGDLVPDAVPAFLLQRKFGYRWLPSAYLFLPNPIENKWRNYGFPAALCSLAWLQERLYVALASLRATGFVVTNEADFRHFGTCFRKGRLFPFYGGVNTDQIPEGRVAKTRDVVFCSRLCVQKGIMGFLDVWRKVHERLPSKRLAVIGNGSPEFEAALRKRAEDLGVADSIDWLGYVNGDAKYEIYRSARVMVHPTVYDNNGMVAAEALCSGLPVVMQDLSALRKVYTTGCVKVAFGDREGFAESVVRMLSDEAFAREVAPNEAEVAALRSRWAWPNRVAAFREWLETLT